MGMSGNSWENNMECTGAGFPITLPQGQRTASKCVMIGMAGQAGDANRMCIKAVGCGATDSASCTCTLHCGFSMGVASGAKSCVQKPVVNPTQTCSQAVCSSQSVAASSASDIVSRFGVGITGLVFLVGASA